MTVQYNYDNVYRRSTTASKVSLYIKKSQGMALSAEANITGLNHTLQQLIAQLALYKLGNPRESTDPNLKRKLEFNCL